MSNYWRILMREVYTGSTVSLQLYSQFVFIRIPGSGYNHYQKVLPTILRSQFTFAHLSWVPYFDFNKETWSLDNFLVTKGLHLIKAHVRYGNGII